MPKNKSEIDNVDLQNDKKTIIHVVEKGEDLRDISQKYLGTPKRANEIRNLNNLATDFLYIGKKLKIPKK